MRRLAALACALAGALAAPLLAPGTARAQEVLEIREAGARPAAGSTEESIWVLSAEAEREALRSPALIQDAALTGYVREVQCSVTPAHCGDIRVHVFRRPVFNATVMANGHTEVWTGLLLRAASESELAFVLGHEGAHFTGNHTLRQWVAVRRADTALIALQLAVASAAAFDPNYVDYWRYAEALQTAAYVGAVAGFFSYSRAFEEEADRVGQARMAAAGYDPAAAGRIWQTVIDLDAASDSERVRRSDSRGSIFRTHPLTRDRLAALAAAAPGLAVATSDRQDRHRAMIRPHLAGWLRDELRGRDYGATLALIDRLAQGGDAGVLNYYRGEVHRLRRGPDDAPLALAAYRASVAAPDAPAEAYRELGGALTRAGDRPGAAEALATYLARVPDAPDRALVTRQIERLTRTAPERSSR